MNNQNQVQGIFMHWLPMAVILTGVCGLLYVAVQQINRQALNDPQIQMARDAAVSLAAGKQAADIIPDPTSDISRSLAPFIGVYAADGMAVKVSATVNGQTPKPPLGVFTAAKDKGENRVTWQPAPSTRIALVVVPSGQQFVAAGRNMSEGERRIGVLGQSILLGWALTIIASLIAEYVSDSWRRRMMAQASQGK
jgi:hypothetical protein